ncbi:envelope stress response activation lipoprotein NlpE [Pigmentiphaga soli]|uniref:Envelope stress response activation lipoprotein NlpE n=1 Tax=Pigmentiphaga soli TaxID=1007095 RepID=A0ABP8HCT7_9BURK
MLPEARQPQSREASAAVPAPPGMSPAAEASAAGIGANTDHGAPLAAAQTFRGVIPCADCAGQRITLTLFPDWTWRQRRVYFGTRDGADASFVTTGRWERTLENPQRIRLIGDRNEAALYEFQNPSTLRLLDQEGQPINSALNYSLTQQFELDPIADSFTMRGRVLPADGRTTFAICATGKSYPVAAGGQADQLAAAYAKLRVAPGTPVLMWIRGHVATQGQPPQEQVVVEGLTGGTLDSPCD